MSISSLSSQYISASFAGLMQYSSSGNLYDGNANIITDVVITDTLNVGDSNLMPTATSAFTAGAGNVIVGSISGFALGKALIVSGSSQTVVGAYNKQGDSTSPFIVGLGNGPATGDRADIFKVTQSGSIVMKAIQNGNVRPNWTGSNGELVITHDGNEPKLYVYLTAIDDWKGITLSEP